MSRALVISALALAGCGRFGFDGRATDDGATGDVGRDTAVVCAAPVGHDEDRDGVDDACDVCPHLSDDQADGDGDRVGDACDPEPTVPRQRIVMFDPFLSLARWSKSSDESVDNDAAVLLSSTGTKALFQPYIPQNDLFEIGADTAAIGPATQSLFMINLDSGTANYYCEMYDDGTPLLQFTYTLDGVTYVHPGFQDAAHSVATNSGRLQMQRSATKVACSAVWGGEPLQAGGPTPGIDANTLVIYAQNVDVRVRYMVQIRTE